MAFHGLIHDWYAGLGPWAATVAYVTFVVVVGSIAILIGRWLVTRRIPGRSHTDTLLRTFLERAVAAGGWLVILLLVLPRLGVHVATLLGGVAVTGFILGFALKDALGNIAAGILILLYRPFKLGELVKIGDNEGRVTGVGLAFTVVQTHEGTTISLPNGTVLQSAILNRTRTPERRIDIVCGIHNADDVGQAIQDVVARARAHPRVLQDREPLAVVRNLTSDGPELCFGFWVKNEDFGRVRGELHLMVKQVLDEGGYSTPTATYEVAKVDPHLKR